MIDGYVIRPCRCGRLYFALVLFWCAGWFWTIFQWESAWKKLIILLHCYILVFSVCRSSLQIHFKGFCGVLHGGLLVSWILSIVWHSNKNMVFQELSLSRPRVKGRGGGGTCSVTCWIFDVCPSCAKYARYSYVRRVVNRLPKRVLWWLVETNGTIWQDETIR
jgi:hypothetical protein